MSDLMVKNQSTEVVKVASKEVLPSADVIDVVQTDANQYARYGWGLIGIFFVGFLIWAFFAPLDQGVPLSGTVSVSGNRKTVQYQNGGTVDEILVKEGDTVKAGQVLFRMNKTSSQANLDITTTQMMTAKAVQARLLAERDGKSNIEFPKELTRDKNNIHAMNVMSLQQQLFASRRSSLQADLASIDENISGLKMQLQGLQESRESKVLQQSLLKEQLVNLRDLAKDGFVARNRLLDLERNYAQINSALAEDAGNTGRLTRQIAELTLRKSQRQQDYQKEVRAQLTDYQKEVEANESRLKALTWEFENTEVKSPVDGVAVGLNVFTKGAVVQPGYKLIEIVPAGEPLIIEGQLPVNLIDKVYAGLPVEMIFSAFNARTTPHIKGEISFVSADRTVDERTGMPYYKVRANATPEGVKLLAKHEVKPGMPVELFVKTGERTFMNYLFKPITDRAHRTLTEE